MNHNETDFDTTQNTTNASPAVPDHTVGRDSWDSRDTHSIRPRATPLFSNVPTEVMDNGSRDGGGGTALSSLSQLSREPSNTTSAASSLEGAGNDPGVESDLLSRLSAPAASQPMPDRSVSGSTAAVAEAIAPGPIVLNLGPLTLPTEIWDGQELTTPIIGVDCETTLIDGNDIPQLVLLSASDGRQVVIVDQQNVGRFLRLHVDAQWVFHNVAFDFWVLIRLARDSNDPELERLLWQKVDQGNLLDTMLLDQLIRLARNGESDTPRRLDEVAREYAGIELNKEDPYRLRYGEILGCPLEHVEIGFITYAAADAAATLLTYLEMMAAAEPLLAPSGSTSNNIGQYGTLTDVVQVKGAIALAAIERVGIGVDREHARGLLSEFWSRHQTALDALLALDQARRVFRYEDGRVVMTASGRLPKINQAGLQSVLREIHEFGRSLGLPPVEENEKGLSTAEEAWRSYAQISPFIRHWLELMSLAKQLQYVSGLDAERVYPRYRTLVRSGRTSSFGPSIQQIPRDPCFRQCFRAAPGHKLLAIDYAFVELVTLAATCQRRFGFSRLGDVIRAGEDPHVHTAALLLRMGLDEFKALKKTDPERYKAERQRSKAINFGVPGGMQAEGLRGYAEATFGVRLTAEEADALRNRLITDVYPELGPYLADRSMERIADVLGCTIDQLWEALESWDKPDWMPRAIMRLLGGARVKADGQPYSPKFLDRVWAGLYRCCSRDDLRELLMLRRGSPEFARQFMPLAITLTGRVRAGAEYTEARNTLFQGLAADGAKLALFELVRQGFRVVAFIHDEVVIELPDGPDLEDRARQADEIIRRAMSRVLDDTLPVRTEMNIGDYWAK